MTAHACDHVDDVTGADDCSAPAAWRVVAVVDAGVVEIFTCSRHRAEVEARTIVMTMTPVVDERDRLAPCCGRPADECDCALSWEQP